MIPIIEKKPVAIILRRIAALNPTCSGIPCKNNRPDKLPSTTPKPAGINDMAPRNDDVLKITVKIAKSIDALTEFSKKYAAMDSKPTTLNVRKKLTTKNFGFNNENITS